MVRVAIALCLALMLQRLLSAASGGDAYRDYGKSHGFYVANGGVDASCITPKLKIAIGQIERHFGRKAVMSSGYRNAFHNARVGGADNSLPHQVHGGGYLHSRRAQGPADRLCQAASTASAGSAAIPGRTFIHIDVRDRPRGWQKPVTFSGC